jgi:hypothetical protein
MIMEMEFETKYITIKEISNGYINNDEEGREGGVVGYCGKLNIRPPYEREYRYNPKRRNAVIESIRKKRPLGEFHWFKNEDGTYEVLDGEQRTISFCEYIINNFTVNGFFFSNLTEAEKEQMLNKQLTIQICRGGGEREKQEWFETINTPGLALTAQELRNARYTGTWLTDAKRHFSKTGCAAWNIARDYVKGVPINQELLETAINWESDGHIENYMARNQHEPNANELWLHFTNTINWAKVIFPKPHKEKKGVPWGILYKKYKDIKYDSNILEEEVTTLMQDEEVTNKKGIFEYILTRNEKYLNLREFLPNQKREAYERQKGICPQCRKHFEIEEMQGHHVILWSKGGKTTAENCRMLCKPCHQNILNKYN